MFFVNILIFFIGVTILLQSKLVIECTYRRVAELPVSGVAAEFFW